MRAKKAVATIGFILFSIAGLCGCGKERNLVELSELESNNTEREIVILPLPEGNVSAMVDAEEINSEESDSEGTTQLTALAEDLEEAEKIADLYGIELDSYSYGVATYITDKDVQELIIMGEENDYPTLAPNYKSKLYTVE